MRKAPYTLITILADLASALLAWICFYFYRKTLTDFQDSRFFDLLLSGFTIACFWVLIYAFFGFYRDVLLRSRIKEIIQVLGISLVGALLILTLLIFYTSIYEQSLENAPNYVKNVSTYFLVHTGVALFFKIGLLSLFKKWIYAKKIRFNTLLIGSADNAKEIYEESSNYKFLGMHFIGFLKVFHNMKTNLDEDIPCLGNVSELENVIKNEHVERVIIAVEPSEHDEIANILTLLEGQQVKISIIPDIYQILLGSVRVSHVFGTAMVEVKQSLLPVWQAVLKRTFDVILSICVLTFGFPFFLIVGLFVKFSSKGPILFKQERIGKHGKPFMIYKFRSMYVDAEKGKPMLSSDNDPRITPVGRILRKTRIDEFPQFFNVLIGEMSLVGPRPERQFFIDQIMKKAPHYRHLHKVRPGITSLGQVKYGYASNVDEMVKRLKYEVIYIENMSLFMDLRIIIYTILIVFQGRGK